MTVCRFQGVYSSSSSLLTLCVVAVLCSLQLLVFPLNPTFGFQVNYLSFIPYLAPKLLWFCFNSFVLLCLKFPFFSAQVCLIFKLLPVMSLPVTYLTTSNVHLDSLLPYFKITAEFLSNNISDSFCKQVLRNLSRTSESKLNTK